jgi:hypothetical protein
MPLIDRKHFLIACAVTTLFAIGVIAGVVLITSNHTKPAPITEPSAITASGNLVCLPHKTAQPGQPQTLECAIGFKTDDGRHYGLAQLSDEARMTPFTKHITISGDVLPPSVDDRYDTRGTITVKSFDAK